MLSEAIPGAFVSLTELDTRLLSSEDAAPGARDTFLLTDGDSKA